MVKPIQLTPYLNVFHLIALYKFVQHWLHLYRAVHADDQIDHYANEQG